MDRASIALNVVADIRLNEGHDMSDIKDIMNSPQCTSVYRTGKSTGMGVNIAGRNLVAEMDESPDAE